MPSGALEFRLRMPINAAILALGFIAPWSSRRTPLLEWLALALSRHGLVRFTQATPLVIAAASLLAAAGVVLRVWGAAYLGPRTVQHPQLQAGPVVADGPYRHVRNPLYLGVWFMAAAMAFVMPPSGALVAMVLLTAFLLRLIVLEERFLADRLGAPYRSYLEAVPRLIPRLGTSVAAGSVRPRWLRAVAAELNPIGVFVTVAVLSWSFDNTLMIRGILVTFGLSLVVRALLPSGPPQEPPARRADAGVDTPG